MVRYLSYEDTVKIDLRMKEVVPAFEEAYRLVAEGTSTTPTRLRLVHPPLTEGMGTGRPWERDLRVTPAMVPGLGAVCRLGATARGHGGGVLLIYWDFETMALQAIISDHLVHAVRSAAPDGPLTKYLAKQDSSVLAVVGTGRIARWAAEAAWSQRPIKTIKAYSRDPAHRESIRRASRIVVTSAAEVERPVPPWQAVYDLIGTGELAPNAASCEIADIIVGRAPGRISDDEIIVCLNPAYGVHDVPAARFVYHRALELGLGADLPI